MINVKLLVLFFCIDIVTSTVKYCEICPNHTLCKYSMAGPSSSCKEYVGSPITKDDVNNIINKINERRNFVASGLSGLPQAANMNKIYWSNELAKIAQRWVDQCDASTRPDKEDECRNLVDTDVGQAIASVEGLSPGLQLKSMIDLWFMQTLDYNGSVIYYNQSRDWKTNYFTQLIWGQTDRIGCGRARFYIDHRSSIIDRLVCNFSPKGNIHGRPVYTVGYPATQCQHNKTPDRKYESLCRGFVEVKERKSTIIKPTASSLLRIRNLSDKPATYSNRNNLKQVKFDVNETSEQRNQKTRHVLFNNSHAMLKNMPPLPMQGHWNSPSNYTRGQRLQQYQQERGHSRVYHGHNIHDNNFGSDYRETTNHDYPRPNYPTTGNYPNNNNYRKHMNDDTTEQFSSEATNDLRKYNKHNECTRKSETNSDGCQHSHQSGMNSCNECSLNGKSCRNPIPPCQTDTPCMTKGRHCNMCPCNTPKPTCATMPPRCQCNTDCKCFNDECANTPCPPYRRSNNGDIKDETKKSADPPYYDLLPNMAIRSGEDTIEQSPLKETFTSTPEDDWIEHDNPTDDIFKRLSPKIRHDYRQVKDTFANKRNGKQGYDYIYDSSYSRERKRRSPADDNTFKPFWQMDEFNRDKSTLLKSMIFTTLSNRKVKKSRRIKPSVKITQTTESITVQLKEEPNVKQKHKNIVTEKYLSFDELMHLRKFSSTETAIDISRDGGTANSETKSDGRRNLNTDARRTTASEYTTNTPFKRKKYCTRKLTCTWTAPTLVGADGSVIVPGVAGDRGSRTPPGYVEGCTRTSTCTREHMERNKFSTIDETGSGESTLEDEDYCEKRALDVRKRDSDTEDETFPSLNDQTHTDTPLANSITQSSIKQDFDQGSITATIPTTSSDYCVCDGDPKRIKRNERSCDTHNDYCRHSRDTLSYGDLYYLVLQKIIQRWKNSQNSFHARTCLCNAAVLIRRSLSLFFILLLFNALIKYIFI